MSGRLLTGICIVAVFAAAMSYNLKEVKVRSISVPVLMSTVHQVLAEVEQKANTENIDLRFNYAELDLSV